MTFVQALRSEWRYALSLLLASRAALMLVGIGAMALFPASFRHLNLMSGLPVLNIWAQWDAEHYVHVAVDGYQAPTVPFSNIAFFPLFPLLIRLVLIAIGRVDTETGAFVGLVIANVALFIALIYLAALLARDFDLSLARRSVLYVLVLPTTIFLSSVYAEALFLACAVASVYHARAGEWYRAGAAGLLAALCRPFGILLAVPIAIELFRQRAPARAWPASIGPPLGLSLYIGYLWWLFDDPFAYFASGESWGRGLNPPWEAAIGYLRGPLRLFDWPFALIDLVSILAMIALVIYGWRLLPGSYTGYAAAGLLFAMSTGYAWFSAARHTLALFPVIVVLALITERSRAAEVLWLGVSIFLAVAFTAMISLGYWVT